MLATILLTAALIVGALPLHAAAGEASALKTEQEKVNYAIGVKFVRALVQRPGTVNLDLVIQGMKDGLTSEKLLLSESEIRMAGAAEPAGKGRNEKLTADVRDRKVGAVAKATTVSSPSTDEGTGAQQSRLMPNSSDNAADSALQTVPSRRAKALIERSRAAKENTKRNTMQARSTGEMQK